MERARIIEILEVYRPGQGLESDPEVREALDAAARDPELAALRDSIEAFDKEFARALGGIEVPAGLQQAILRAAREREAAPKATTSGGSLIHLPNWIHPAAFGAAAAIVILLALSFTFLERPGQPAPMLATASMDGGLMETAHQLYKSLNPTLRNPQGNELIEFVRSRGGVLPSSLPGGASWEDSFACDVVEVNGTKVSIICFLAPDRSRTMHLFTFEHAAFPDFKGGPDPRVCPMPDCCCASWVNGDKVHVLYSDKGMENLRAVLDI